MSNGRVVLVDMDGVLADFESGFLRAWRRAFPEEACVPLSQRTGLLLSSDYNLPHHNTMLDEILSAKGFFAGLKPMNGSLVGLERLEAAGFSPYICTSPISCSQTCVQEKHDWVLTHLGKKMSKRVIIASDKTLVRGNYLIDDNPNIKGELEPSWQPVVFAAPYNRNAQTRFRLDGWSDLERLIGAITDGRHL